MYDIKKYGIIMEIADGGFFLPFYANCYIISV